ncbi:MAG TPA: class I SAM-dependent methyltransferase family protein [Candidatus Thermoplasmatota archaeon]|nr:class I SAM-dependent methyltransferase family protein [Candidatus Thermoplasmatota archaeon]
MRPARFFRLVQAPALRVPLHDGERARRMLLDEGALRLDLKVRREGGELLLPLLDATPRLGYPVALAEFEPVEEEPRHYAERLGHLPDAARALLPSAFDVIGHVLIVKVPDELRAHEADIARALLDTTPRVRTVADDEGVKGELRLRALRVLAGEPTTATEHVEHGIRIRVDPATCYFSPRLATERRRVAALVRPGERVVDLMAGVGPFALVVAKHSDAARIDAVDLNDAAIAFARENARLNKLDARVFPEHADARAWAAAHPGVADRVITNLPHSAHAFAEDALRVLKEEGVWHYHCIQPDEDLGRHLAELASRAADVGRSLRVTATRVVRAYSPREKHFAVDFDVGPLRAGEE